MNALGITSKSAKMQEAVWRAIQVAPYDVSVLVTGENGTGKNYFYKILHNGSRRRHKKCIAVNCGGLPEGTIDSELFGHVKGAFTGAVSDRTGYFEEADGGTIFLDEVGDLPLSIQAKLLRVLEGGEIIRMGSSEVRKVDVRVVAATNVDLEKAIREGKFRQDLYFRLSAVNIHVPALRERPEDIDLLFRRFASDAANRYRITDSLSLTDEARQMLRAYDWPGNVRQLLHVVEEMTLIEPERVITLETLQKYLPKSVGGISAGSSASGEDTRYFRIGEKEFLYQLLFTLRKELEEVRTRLGMSKPVRFDNAHSLPSKVSNTPSRPKAYESAPYKDANDAYESDSSPITKITVHPASPVEEQVAQEVEATYVENPDAGMHAPSRTGDNTYLHSDGTPMTLKEIERDAIEQALKRNNGTKRNAAKDLDIAERTIHRKLGENGLLGENEDK